MANLAEVGCARLTSVTSIDLGTASDTELYEVPAGKKCVVHYLVLRELSADAAATVAMFGQGAGFNDFVGNQTLAALNAAGSAGIIMPVPNAATVEIQEYTAGEVISIDVTTASGSGAGTPTCTLDVYGSLDDA